ncbi:MULTISPECIES: S1 family peptidase [Nocardia]|uniref:S1 family peptidase n=1 Tax=Nocardia aurea TaxID=2144174 RepID=A0ABV3FLZ9_9NOCA|nr:MULTISPECIES: S1 family peptidase [Nocardia]
MRFRGVAAVVAVIASVGAVVAGMAQAAPGSVVLGGSSGLVFDNNSACSLTAIGYDNANRLVGLTAGHCAPTGARLASEGAMEAGAVGVVAYSDNGEGLDYAVLQFDPAKVTPARVVGATTINGIGGQPGPGTTVCSNGRTSGPGCGVVWGTLDESVTINQACSKPGDSGGPVTVGDKLVGMNQGRLTGLAGIGFDLPCATAANPIHSPAFFAPIDIILAAVNATGGVGSGFRTF